MFLAPLVVARSDSNEAIQIPAQADWIASLRLAMTRTGIDTNKVKNTEAIVLYLWSDKDNFRTEIVPCRFAAIVNIEFAGSSCIISLRIGDFVGNLDDAKFRSSLRAAEIALLPTWTAKAGNEPVLNGKFFFDIAANLAGHSTNDLAAFEKTATALVRYKDFSDPQSTVFYTVRRVVKTGRGSGVAGFQPHSGSYKLSSGEHYVVEIYSFVPSPVELGPAKLQIGSDVSTVEFPLGKERDIDSHYDLKRFPFQVPQQIRGFPAGVHIYVTGPEGDDVHSDIMIPVQFRGSLLLAIARVAFIGIGTSGPGMIAAETAGKLNFGIAVLMLFLGCVAALGTVFTSFKK
jgi:hypothetical protein